RGVLPASVRPMVKAQKEQDAREEQELKEQQENGMLAPLDELNAEIQQENNGPATAEKKAAPSLVPDLVGKDRYDKASKCFSYVPSKALKEAFSQPKKPTPKRVFDTSKENLDVPQDRDAWRQRNCRSVTSAPEREDPDVTRRRTQERMLLEELKNANDSPRPAGRDYNEVAAPRDPLEAYRREEERLRNTSSPFDDLPKRMGRGVRGKPPTPPPRERSRSPPQSRVNTPGLEQHYRQPHQNGYTSAKETNIDDDFGDFAHLGNIVKNENASPAPTHRHVNHHQHQQQYETPQGQRKQSSEYARPSTVDPSAWAKGRETPSGRYPDNRYAEYGSLSRAQTPSGQFYSGQERVAAAIVRAETPSRQYYGTQERAQSVGGRAETPNFPLRGETPLPYHPLLYSQGTASRPDLSRNRSEPDGQTMNHRSASPRSNYYSQSLSRRSSLNSVVCWILRVC
ncbi:unnamed protein product, partial [Mesorhabditis spiculigera]